MSPRRELVLASEQKQYRCCSERSEEFFFFSFSSLERRRDSSRRKGAQNDTWKAAEDRRCGDRDVHSCLCFLCVYLLSKELGYRRKRPYPPNLRPPQTPTPQPR